MNNNKKTTTTTRGISIQYVVQAALLTIMVFLTSCASPPKDYASLSASGFGGTGNKPMSGFGGTGNRLASGFGGTGIVGTVTMFGSIWVNGLEVEYSKDTKISSNLSKLDKLELGKQVVLETQPQADQTTKISIYYPIAGKITAVKPNELLIDNKYIVKTEKSRFDKKVQLEVGQFVAINGYQISSKNWIATRVNTNLQHKVFYQPTPSLNFSESVKHVLIETSRQQIKQWGVLHGSLNKLSHNQEHVLVVGTYSNSHIEVASIDAYSPGHSTQTRARKMLDNLRYAPKRSSSLRKGGKMTGNHKSSNDKHGGADNSFGSGFGGFGGSGGSGGSGGGHGGGSGGMH